MEEEVYDYFEDAEEDCIDNEEDDKLDQLLMDLHQYVKDNKLPFLTHPDTYNIFKHTFIT